MTYYSDKYWKVRDLTDPEKFYYVLTKKTKSKSFYWKETEEKVPDHALVEVPERVLEQIREFKKEPDEPAHPDPTIQKIRKKRKLEERKKRIKLAKERDGKAWEQLFGSGSENRRPRGIHLNVRVLPGLRDPSVESTGFLRATSGRITEPVQSTPTQPINLLPETELDQPGDASGDNAIKECGICFEELQGSRKIVALGVCRHWCCSTCVQKITQCHICGIACDKSKQILLT